MRIMEAILIVLVIPFVLFALYSVFVVLPVSLYTEQQCLQKGYPKYRVTYLLDRYCVNLAGSVTVLVEKQ